MLFEDHLKYAGLLFGITFTSFLVTFAAAYFGYARLLGNFDGLPPLPAQFEDKGDIDPTPIQYPRSTGLDRKLEMAFGQNCAELNFPFKIEMKDKGIVPVWNPSDLAARTGDTGVGGGGESGHNAAWARDQAKKGTSTVKKGQDNTNGQRGAGGDKNGHKAPDNSSGYKIKPELVNPKP